MPAPLLSALVFALMGDVPYAPSGVGALNAMIDEMNAQRLAFVVHIGDITSGRGPCGDDWLEARQRQFARFTRPFVLLPGDNEWTDCRRTGFDPLERLEKWRSLFCVSVDLPAFERQSGKYCENVRWLYDNAVFVGLNVPGGNNNLGNDPLEHGERMHAVFAWLDQAEALARQRDALVVLMHANPFQRRLLGADGYAAVRERLRRLGRERPGKVLLVHGDTHYFRDNEPLPGLQRVEVFGWPQIRWVKARVGSAGTPRFQVEAIPP
jgi:hypothetical protein